MKNKISSHAYKKDVGTSKGFFSKLRRAPPFFFPRPSSNIKKIILLYFTEISPDDPFDVATADMISDGAVDLGNGVLKFYFQTDEAKKVLSCTTPRQSRPK